MRKYLRQIARERMTAQGIGNVNKGFSRRDADGVPNWKKALTGESGKAAERAQMFAGKKLKAARDRKHPHRRKVTLHE